jgi:hypothetical protein
LRAKLSNLLPAMARHPGGSDKKEIASLCSQ